MKRLAAVALLLAACASPPPIAPLGHTTNEGLRIAFFAREIATNEDASRHTQENNEAMEKLRKVLIADLEKAGYTVVTSKGEPFDLAAAWSVNVFVEKREDPEYREVKLDLYAPKKEAAIEKIHFKFKPGIAPSSEPERVSHEVVNAVVASPAVDAVAKKKKAKAD